MFSNCSNLSGAELPDSLTFIAENAFDDIQSVHFDVEPGSYADHWINSQLIDWGTVTAEYTSAGEQNHMEGTEISSEHLNCVLKMNETVGGWFKLQVPLDGDYYFNVFAPTIDYPYFRLRNNSGEGQAFDWTVNKSDKVQTFVLENLTAGEYIYWWDGQPSPNTGWTMLSSWYLMISNREHDLLSDYISLVQSHLSTVHNNHTYFTTGTSMNDGSVAKVDVESMNNGVTRVLTAFTTGEYAGRVDWTNVQGMYFADLFMRKMSTSNSDDWISVDLIEDLLSFFDVEEDAIDLIDYWLKEKDGKTGEEGDILIREIRIDNDGNEVCGIRWDRTLYEIFLKKLAKRTEEEEKPASVLEGVNTAISVIDHTAKIINALIAYSSVPDSSIDWVAAELESTGYAPLQAAAYFLSKMKDTAGKLIFIALNVLGEDFAKDIEKAGVRTGFKALIKYASKYSSYILSKFPNAPTAAAGAVLVGVQIGAKVGQVINNVFWNVDGIYSAWQKTKWCADAADAMYRRMENVAASFYAHPENSANRAAMRRAAAVYTELVADIYSAFGGVYSEIDKAWVKAIKNWVTNDHQNAQALSSCTSVANLMREYMDFILSEDEYNHYATGT